MVSSQVTDDLLSEGLLFIYCNLCIKTVMISWHNKTTVSVIYEQVENRRHFH